MDLASDPSREEAAMPDHPSPVESPARPTTLLLRAADQARLAPSVHNTQPWRFAVRDGSLEIYGDPARQLRVVDPAGRQLTISCGCALFNARVALAADGRNAVVTELPDPTEPELLASIATGAQADGWTPLSALDSWIPARRSNRRQYFADPVPAELSYTLAQAAAVEGAQLIELTAPPDRRLVAELGRRAEIQQLLIPAYRAEIRAWTTDDPRRPDGVQAMSVPRVSGDPSDELPVRDFDSRGMGWLPARTGSADEQCLFLLSTAGDDRLNWLHAGQALERLWLEATRQGYAVSLFSQAIEAPEMRQLLRDKLGVSGYPQLIVRVGHAPSTPVSRRRELTQLLID
jgi:nitroreductase